MVLETMTSFKSCHHTGDIKSSQQLKGHPAPAAALEVSRQELAVPGATVSAGSTTRRRPAMIHHGYRGHGMKSRAQGTTCSLPWLHFRAHCCRAGEEGGMQPWELGERGQELVGRDVDVGTGGEGPLLVSSIPVPVGMHPGKGKRERQYVCEQLSDAWRTIQPSQGFQQNFPPYSTT